MVVILLVVAERLKEIERLINNYLREKDPSARRKCLIQIQRRLIKSQEYGDDKLQLVGNMIDMVIRETFDIFFGCRGAIYFAQWFDLSTWHRACLHGKKVSLGDRGILPDRVKDTMVLHVKLTRVGDPSLLGSSKEWVRSSATI